MEQSALKRIYPQYRLFKAVQPDLEPTEKGNSFLESANRGLLSEAELQITLMRTLLLMLKRLSYKPTFFGSLRTP